jgi:hypothetical protein
LATIVHTNWLDLMLGGGNHTLIDFDADTVKGALLDNAVATAIAANEDWADVSAGVIGTPTALTTPSASGGVLTLGAALVFSSVTGDSAEQLTVYKDTGTASTSPLAITWDSASTGLPVTPNGGDITATWGSSILVTLA